MLYESKSFRFEIRDRIATIWIDLRNQSHHALTRPTLNELALIVDRIATVPSPDVILLRSSRPGVFLDDFAIEELASFASPLEFAAVARRGQELADKIANLRSPTVAVIEGRCSGVGVELALACDFRIAVDDLATSFDHPAVGHGLIPCWGGTVRLSRLIGLRNAKHFFASMTPIDAISARRLGLVDRVSPAASWHCDSNAFIERLREHPNRKRDSLRRIARTILDWPFAARLRHNQMTNKCDELERSLLSGLSSVGEGLAAERAAVSRIAETTQCKNLLALHRCAFESGQWFAETTNPIPNLPQNVGVVGGGERGVDLAIRLARHGHDVIVHTLSTFESADFAPRLSRRLDALVAKNQYAASGARTIQNRIRATAEWTGFENVDLAFEATTEDPGVKRNVFQELESRVRPRVILASCSSAVPLESIQAEMSRPNRAFGFCLSDFTANPIVELVATSISNRESLAALSTWARTWGMTPVLAADRPGRLITRVRLAYLSEGVRLCSEGIPIDKIDLSLRQFGMARGPLEWCDEIGIDNVAEQTAHLQMALGDDFARNLLFERLLAHRIVGRATDEGFYRYGQRRRPNQLVRSILWHDLHSSEFASYVFDPKQALSDGIDRVVLRTINEAAMALPDEPDADPATVDMALAFGMGWAPSRGGPLRHADEIGLDTVVQRLSHFAERYGRDYAPCDELIRRAEAGETFYEGAVVKPIGQQAWRMVG